MFICGSGSFGHEDENERYNSPCSTPKRSKRNTSFCRLIGKDSSNKNPYADRGLDKFNALLAELDDKKQKIYTQVGSDEISLLRFVYPNDSNHVKPIVVKATKERINPETLTQGLVIRNQKGNNPPAVVQVVQDKIERAEISDKEGKRSFKTCSSSLRLEKLRHPYYYFPLILMLILLFLVVYGRSFAILCTSIGWYLIPTVNGTGNSSASSTRTLKRKKDSVIKFSEKKIVNNQGSSSPTSVLSGLNPDKSPRQQEIGRRRSF